MSDTPILPDRYQLIDKIGEGGTCSVYRVQDTHLQRDVAIKIVRRNLAIHARFRARFAREVTLSAKVVHPRVIPVLDTGRLDDGRPFVSLAFADQGSLSDKLRQRPPWAKRSRSFTRSSMRSRIHAHGFLHQDLKPANVLLHSQNSSGPDAGSPISASQAQWPSLAAATGHGWHSRLDGTRAAGRPLRRASAHGPICMRWA